MRSAQVYSSRVGDSLPLRISPRRQLLLFSESGCKTVTPQNHSTDSNSSAMPPTPKESHSCPFDCPNRRHKARQPVVGGGYIFALLVAVILAIQSFDASYKRVHGEEDVVFATKTPPSTILILGLTLIGLGLGIEIDKTAIFSSTKGLLGGLVNDSKSEGD